MSSSLATRGQDDRYSDETLGLGPVVFGELVRQEIDGDPLSVFRSPQVNAIAVLLHKALRQAAKPR